MSNMLESRLITSQWCKLLTSMRETTNNDNVPQGTISTIHKMWIEELDSNTREITRSKANDVNLSSSENHLPLGHASSKVLEGSLSVNFQDNELKSTEMTLSKEGHNVSHKIDMRQKHEKWFWAIQRNKGKCNWRRTTLEQIGDKTRSLVAFGSMGSVAMMTWQR